MKKRIPALAGFLAAASFLLWFVQPLRARSVFSAQEAPVTVVIDPGHGGEDGGASSAAGVTEAGINLEIALRLRDLLTFAGIRTSLLRETDCSLTTDGETVAQRKVSDLKNRVQAVNGTPNALLVSIHQNFFEQSRYFGAQVFYSDSAESHALAEKTQTLLRETLDAANRRECKPSKGVYLMQHVTCPAILVECGFLSNPAEAEKLQNKLYQQKIAAAVSAALIEAIRERNEHHETENSLYLQSVRQRNTPLAGTVSRLRRVELHCGI